MNFNFELAYMVHTNLKSILCESQFEQRYQENYFHELQN